MDYLYNNIGYIGWTADAAALAAAVDEKHKEKRSQYVFCPAETQLPDCVKAVSGPEEMAKLCKLVVLTEGSDLSALESLQTHISAGITCADFTLALPTEKYARAKNWEAQGGFYVDVAAEKPLMEMLKEEKPYFFLSGHCAQMVYRLFFLLVFPVYVPGAVGEATLMRLLRTTPTTTLSELMTYITHFRNTCPVPASPALFSDAPENEGIANALKRARQMSDVLWQPVKPFPKLMSGKLTTDFSAEFPMVGLPYSSARLGETFIGVNIPFEGFFTAARDENSIVYTKDRRNDGNAAAWYGSVCSVFVGHTLNLPTRAACKNWPKVPGMQLVQPCAVESLKLGDMLLNDGHIVIVTGIDRTADGKIYQVEISESTPPACRRKLWRADEVDTYFLQAAKCAIYRYDYIAETPYTPCAYTPLAGEDLTVNKNDDLFMLLGDRVNCNLGQALTFRIKTAGWKNLQLRLVNKIVASLPLSGEEQFVTYTPGDCGDYTAVCAKDGTTSKAAEFTVVNSRVTTEKSTYAPGETISVTACDDSGAKATSFALVVSSTGDTVLIRNLDQMEQETGKFTLTCDVPGVYHLRVFFRNQNGMYRVDCPNITIAQDEN
ncbi:MAG: hypothetical protein IKB80_05440 [Oscillospiraceae bacterium]|nr:hypothetical protein [Oscillospiraceae bacterium]